MWGTGTGSEVMQRIAAPMVGGMITAPLLSMFVIPAAYLLIHQQVVEPARAAVHVEVRHQALQADDDVRREQHLGREPHEVGRDRQDGAHHHGVDRVTDRMHQHIDLLRQMVRDMDAPQEATDAASRLVTDAVKPVPKESR